MADTETGLSLVAGRRRIQAFALVTRGAVFAFLWWALTEGVVDSWLIGVPTVVAATVAAGLLAKERRKAWKLRGAMRFAAYFVWGSFRAGFDVAIRAVTLNIAPRIVKYRCSLEDETARTLFSGVVSLLPGTLTTEFQGRDVYVHVLDSRRPVVEELEQLEGEVAHLCGELTQTIR